MALFALGRTRTGYGYYVAYISGLTLFTLLRNTADDTGIGFKGQYSVDIERRLFGGTLPTKWLQDRLFDPGKVGVIAVVCAVVYVSYFFAAHIVALVFWRRNPAEFKRYTLAVLLTVYTGLAVMFLVPTAPPWLASEHSNAPRMTRVLADAFGWNPEQAGHGTAGGNPFAAMPSLHSAHDGAHRVGALAMAQASCSRRAVPGGHVVHARLLRGALRDRSARGRRRSRDSVAGRHPTRRIAEASTADRTIGVAESNEIGASAES